MQPAIFKDFGSRIWTVVVALHHYAAANRDFARAAAIAVRVGSRRLSNCRWQDFQFDAGQWLTNRAVKGFGGHTHAGTAGSFRKAVGLQNVKAESFKVAPNLGIKARASGNEVAHTRAQSFVNSCEKDFSQVQSDRAGTDGNSFEKFEAELLQATTLRDFLHHTLMNEQKELRYTAE